jgi:hypothetical protein
MKNINIIIAVLLISTSFNGYAQKSYINDNQQLVTSSKKLLSGKLNGQVSLKDILVPDENFDCLQKLGKPLNIKEEHTEIEDAYTFFYEGMTLYYSNVGSEDVELYLIELTSNKSFISLGNSQKSKLNVKDEQFISHFYEDDLANLKMDSKAIKTIIFEDYDGGHIEIEREEGNIRKIKLYF